ncbi:hypothetical protein HPP92_010254 [Vanilla planifolia]|uniref:SMAX1-like AAA+ ATPase lid domain-containing protein n=1 Tax=Vanilla planifolia TaxID=51239 RepID=A0A835V3A1_VANPL|nr:hypothetical protein HPP92_010254 [Vanilla planifolia]
MANALADLVFGAPPLIVRRGSLPAVCGDDAGESYVSLRGRTSIDRVVDTLRLNPFSTIIFEDFDRTDCTFRGMVRRAMERGRLSDSHGREVGLGSSIFILATTLIPEEFGCPNEELRRSEERVMDMATSGRRLQLLLEDNTNKRRPEWLFKDERRTKHRKDSISLDLNLATAAIGGRDEDTGEGSWISSDLTVEHEQEHRQGHLVIDQSMPLPTDSSSWGSGWTELIDAAIVFKPVDFGSLRSRVSKSVSSKFVEIMGQGRTIAIDDDALDQMVGGVWLSGNAHNVFDEWIEQVLSPAVEQLRGNPNVDNRVALRLTSVKSGRQLHMGWLPSMVEVAVDGS